MKNFAKSLSDNVFSFGNYSLIVMLPRQSNAFINEDGDYVHVVDDLITGKPKTTVYKMKPERKPR